MSEKVIIVFPGRPAKPSKVIIKKTVLWLHNEKGIEAVYRLVKDEGEKFIEVEIMKPDGWDEDQVSDFVGEITEMARKFSEEVLF